MYKYDNDEEPIQSCIREKEMKKNSNKNHRDVTRYESQNT
jgi:hypothetical protein